jgi:tetratricopeptide (TPR) repeat protein
MKKVTVRLAGHACLFFIFGALLLAPALPLAAQKDFNQSEKATIEKYKRAKVHYNKGIDYLQKGKLAKAQKEADASLEAYPGFADAHLLLALLQYQQGIFELALKEIESAKSGFGAISDFYAVSYQDHFVRLREQRNQAVARLEELKYEGGDLILIHDAEHALWVKDEELRNWKADVALKMPAEYHFVHGNILFKMKRINEAQGYYLEAVLTDPRYANAYTNLIGIYLTRGDAANALKYLQQAEGNGVALNEKLKKAVLDRK